MTFEFFHLYVHDHNQNSSPFLVNQLCSLILINQLSLSIKLFSSNLSWLLRHFISLKLIKCMYVPIQKSQVFWCRVHSLSFSILRLDVMELLRRRIPATRREPVRDDLSWVKARTATRCWGGGRGWRCHVRTVRARVTASSGWEPGTRCLIVVTEVIEVIDLELTLVWPGACLSLPRVSIIPWPNLTTR